MHPQSDRALILKTIPYGERHKVVTALLENHGRITALAKNSVQSRRFGGSLEPFTMADWSFSSPPSSDMIHLQEAHVVRAFEGLQQDFDRLALASGFSEIIFKITLPTGETQHQLFKLFFNALWAAEELKSAEDGKRLLNAFLAKILQWCGSQPHLHRCLSCEKSLSEIFESYEDTSHGDLKVTAVVRGAGWLCPACSHTSLRESTQGDSRVSLSVFAIRDFYLALQTPMRKVVSELTASDEDQKELLSYLLSLLNYHVPGFGQSPLNSLKFIENSEAI